MLKLTVSIMYWLPYSVGCPVVRACTVLLRECLFSTACVLVAKEAG